MQPYLSRWPWMRREIEQAIAAFYQGVRHENWYGKTYREFWQWFSGEHDRIVAMAAGPAEEAQVREALVEVTAAADDGGFAGPEEMMDKVIERPAKLTADELAARIEALRAKMPEILALDEKDQMDAFAGIADEIMEDADGAHRAKVWSQLQCILRDAGLIPGDDEPCDAS